MPACRINNAGSNGYRYGPLLEATDEALEEIVETNVLGTMLSCREVCCYMMSRKRGLGESHGMLC